MPISRGVAAFAVQSEEGRVEDNGVDDTIFIRVFHGKRLEIPFGKTTTIKDIKCHLQNKLGIPPDQQILLFGWSGTQLELTGGRAAQYGIEKGCTLNMGVKLIEDIPPLELYLQNEELAPEHDFDLTNISDEGKKFMRGGFDYKRPCGWNRIAIKVLDKYENNAWLGVGIPREEEGSVEDEWPVAYTALGKRDKKTMNQDGFRICKSRGLIGRRFYSSPDIDVASKYAQETTFRGNKFKVVYQNRINPETIIKNPHSSDEGEFWISPNETELRRYGICLKKIMNAT